MNDYAAEVQDHRRRKDAAFRTASSPLSPQLQETFSGLSYYPPDPAYRVTVPLERTGGDEVELQTSTGDLRSYVLYARAEVQLPTGRARLGLYALPGEARPQQLFVPFRDVTSGSETYGAGRYLEAPLDDDLATLDFNLAYHPYCAYAERWSCPLPPRENWLAFPVRAGERNPL